VFAHIYYESYIAKFIKSAKRTVTVADQFYVTTPKPEIAREILRRASKKNIPVTVIVSQNRGRHFAPLFAEFSQELSKFDYVVHIHSKKSPHRFGLHSSSWARQAWKFLLGGSQQLKKLVDIFELDDSLGLGYAVDLRITPPAGFSWHSNFEAARTYLGHKKVGSKNQRFPYPAGGMFICRSSVILPLAQHFNDYELYPIERGQLDGTTQHAIERLVGVTATNLGFKHLIYNSRADQLTTEVDFVNL
jgi:lipopolysaccharide biosynthesis protein